MKIDKELEELAESMKETLLDDMYRIARSGLYDSERYKDKKMTLAKVVLTAALRRNTEAYAPPQRMIEELGDVRNLEYV